MERVEIRAVIKHFFLKGWNGTQVKTELDSVYGDSSPSFETVRYWLNEFKNGRTSVQDAARPGRPKTVSDAENVRKVHKMVIADRRVTVSEIEEALEIIMNG